MHQKTHVEFSSIHFHAGTLGTFHIQPVSFPRLWCLAMKQCCRACIRHLGPNYTCWCISGGGGAAAAGGAGAAGVGVGSGGGA